MKITKKCLTGFEKVSFCTEHTEEEMYNLNRFEYLWLKQNYNRDTKKELLKLIKYFEFKA